MKILVTYYSKTGNTEKVARDLAKNLKADIDEIIDLKNRDGIKGWLLGGRDAMKGFSTKIKVIRNPRNYDLVLIGTPIWAWNSTPAIRSYINKFKKQFKKVVIFVTSHSTKADKTVNFLEKKLDKKVKAFEGWYGDELTNKTKYHKKMDTFLKKIREL